MTWQPILFASIYILVVGCLSNSGERYKMLLTTLDAFLFCIVCLGNVRQGECASSAAWDCKLAGKWQGGFVRLINWIFRDPNHCERSWKWQQHIYKNEGDTHG